MIEHGTLEANVTRHCTNRCTNCSHANPFHPPYFMAPEQLAQDLAALKPVLKVKQFYCLGGEPLLHPQILDLLDVGRASGIAQEICVLTNAMLLDRMPEAFFQKINVLRISVYPKLPRERMELAKAKQKQYGFYLGFDGVSLFWKQFEANPLGESFHQCPWKGACWTVHDGHFYLCPQAAFWPDRFFGLPQWHDGLPLAGLTEEKLSAYVNRKEPFIACRLCGSYKKQVPWTESATYEDWIRDSKV